MIALADQHCQPRKGDAHRLDAAAARAQLPEQWDIVDAGTAIRRTFRFKDYHHTMAFVNALAYIAHCEDHHPDLGVHYDRCVVTFSTHDVGGISLNDLICAAKTDRLGADLRT